MCVVLRRHSRESQTWSHATGFRLQVIDGLNNFLVYKIGA